MTLEEIKAVDRSNMYELLRSFPEQVNAAVEIGDAARIPLGTKRIENIVLSGLGGSAIGGDLLRSYLVRDLRVPFFINRHYTLPAFVGPKTLAIISSYSGNTEETNAAHREALKRRAKVLCITSNGITEKLARAKKSPLISVPGGLPPRAALGYSFFPLLIALTKLGLVKERTRDIRETLTLLKNKTDDYANPSSAQNPAMLLAQQLRGHIGVFYSSTEHFDAVNTRWRGQMAENAKTLTFGNVLPEMNHNELVGWKTLGDQMHDIQVVFLRDKDDHRRIQLRMHITKEVIAGYTSHATEVWSEGRSLLARMFSLICLGDWVSFYLAILHGEDPTPIAVIEYLKNELGKV
jgi:glucose/mannose-6-phosphate isomerase